MKRPLFYLIHENDTACIDVAYIYHDLTEAITKLEKARDLAGPYEQEYLNKLLAAVQHLRQTILHG